MKTMSALLSSPARKASKSDSLVSKLDAKPLLMPKPSKSVAMVTNTAMAMRVRQVMRWILRSEYGVRTKRRSHEEKKPCTVRTELVKELSLLVTHKGRRVCPTVQGTRSERILGDYGSWYKR